MNEERPRATGASRFPFRRSLSWLPLLVPGWLLVAAATPWLFRALPALAAHTSWLRAPGTDLVLLAQALAFPFPLCGVLAASFLLWIGLAAAVRRRVRRTRMRGNGPGTAVPLLGLVLVGLALVAFASLPMAAAPGSEQSGGQGRSARVVSWNTHDELAADQLAHLLDGEPEAVVLPETSADSLDALLAREGATGRYQRFSSQGLRGAGPTSVLVSRTLGEYRVAPGAQTTLGTVTVEPVEAASSSPVVVAVHTASPTGAWMPRWRQDVAAVLDAVCGEGGTGSPATATRPVVAAGDFNANPWHGRMARLSAGPCTDALPAAGSLEGTWPSSSPRGLRTQIDHVLVRGASVRSAGLAQVQGTSDHLPVEVRLDW